MADGQWKSGVYDYGREAQSKTRVPTAPSRPGVMEGTTPSGYNLSAKEANKDSRTIGVIILALRSLLVVFTLITVGVMAASKQNITKINPYGYSVSVSIKFTKVDAFVGLLSVAVIFLFYSMVQLMLCVIQVLTSGLFITPATSGASLLIFIFDSVLAYALIAAAAAAASAQAILKKEKVCDSAFKFGGTTSASIAIAFIAFIVQAACAALYPFRLYRLAVSR